MSDPTENPVVFFRNQPNFTNNCITFVPQQDNAFDLGNIQGDFIGSGGEEWDYTLNAAYTSCDECTSQNPCTYQEFQIEGITYTNGVCTQSGFVTTARVQGGIGTPSIGDYVSITNKGAAYTCWLIIADHDTPEPVSETIDAWGTSCTFCALPTPTPTRTPTRTPTVTPTISVTPSVTKSPTPTRTPTKTPTVTPSQSIPVYTLTLNNGTADICADGRVQIIKNGSVVKTWSTSRGSGITNPAGNVTFTANDTVILRADSDGAGGAGCFEYFDTRVTGFRNGSGVVVALQLSGTNPNDYTIPNGNATISATFTSE